jgi:hypothetical protein
MEYQGRFPENITSTREEDFDKTYLHPVFERKWKGRRMNYVFGVDTVRTNVYSDECGVEQR